MLDSRSNFAFNFELRRYSEGSGDISFDNDSGDETRGEGRGAGEGGEGEGHNNGSDDGSDSLDEMDGRRADGFVDNLGDGDGDAELGRAVQVDSIKATLKAPGTERLKPKCAEPLSNFAFKFNLRRYSWVTACPTARAAPRVTRLAAPWRGVGAPRRRRWGRGAKEEVMAKAAKVRATTKTKTCDTTTNTSRVNISRAKNSRRGTKGVSTGAGMVAGPVV
jgi:hypothetical protein